MRNDEISKKFTKFAEELKVTRQLVEEVSKNIPKNKFFSKVIHCLYVIIVLMLLMVVHSQNVSLSNWEQAIIDEVSVPDYSSNLLTVA